jgi:hypothetical protein
MRVTHRNIGWFVAGAVVLAGCGSAGEQSQASVPEASIVATSVAEASSTTTLTSAPASTAPATTAPATTAPTTTAGGPIDGAFAAAVSTLRSAFDPFAESRPFRVATSTGQTMQVSNLGVNVTTEIDPANPTTIVEVLPNGDTHTTINLGPSLASIANGDPALADQLAAITLEIWVVGDQMVIDTTDYQVIADLSPGADLGLFAPGLFSIDLTQLEGVGGADLVAALAGSSVPDPAELGATLPDALTDLRQDPSNPDRFIGTASYADLIVAQGGDVRTMTRSVATGIAQMIGLDVDELAAAYETMYAESQTEIELTLADGALATLSTSTDLSATYERMFSEEFGLFSGEVDGVSAMFENAVLIVDTASTFEIDDTITITLPEGDYEDRTATALAFFAQVAG